MKNIARKEILKVKPYIPGKPIEEVKRELGLKGAIKMASNENAFPPSRKATLAARKALLSANRYPDGGCFYLKKALGRRFKLRPENIIVGNGSDEIIVLALGAFLKKGDEVIIARPTFLIYEIASKISGARIKFAPLKDFRYDIPKMASLISKKTKFIFVANPDNPTGTYVTKKEVDFLVSRAPKNTILYFDEAYFEFAKGLRDFPNTMKYLKSKNVIVTRTFSKAYSLAGLRVGYGFAKKGIIDCLNRVREPFNVNSVGQAAALAALNDTGYVEKTLRLVKKGKDFIYRELEAMGVKYVPSVTNFVLVNVGKNAGSIYGKLLRRGVIVREMRAWKLNNFIRVTVGTMGENHKFIKTLKEVM
ncbi:MAG: histidinol-phosphate transaminase [Candidatus Omnitrophota bacterium]